MSEGSVPVPQSELPQSSSHVLHPRHSVSANRLSHPRRAQVEEGDGWSSSSDGDSFHDGSSTSSDDSMNEDVVDSDEESTRPRKQPGKPAPRRPLIDSSDDEDGAGKKGRKAGQDPKPHAEATSKSLQARNDGARAPRFNWSSGDGARARDYLASRYQEWAHAHGDERVSILKRVAEHVVTTFTFPKHNAGDVREAVKTWFRNQRSAMSRGDIQVPGEQKSKGSKPAPAHHDARRQVKAESGQDLARFMKPIKGRATAASHLWARANADVVNDKLKGSSIGERQRVVADLFKNLPKTERDEWKAKAKLAQEEAENNPDQCFENQHYFCGLVGRLLNQFVGFGPEGVGAVIMDLRIAMREQDGSIRLANLTIGKPDGHPAYNEFEGGADVNEQARWDRFVDSALPQNPLRRDPRLLYDDDGTPSLPNMDSTWTQNDLATTLSAYYRAIWAHGQSNKGATPALDWDAIKTSPSVYLESAWVAKGVADPATLDYVGVVIAYSNILAAQVENQPFRFRHPHTEEERAGLEQLPSTSTTGESTDTTALAPADPPPHTAERPIPQTPSHRSRVVVYRTPERTPDVNASREPSAAPSNAPQASAHGPSRRSVLPSVPEQPEGGDDEQSTPAHHDDHSTGGSVDVPASHALVDVSERLSSNEVRADANSDDAHARLTSMEGDGHADVGVSAATQAYSVAGGTSAGLKGVMGGRNDGEHTEKAQESARVPYEDDTRGGMDAADVGDRQEAGSGAPAGPSLGVPIAQERFDDYPGRERDAPEETSREGCDDLERSASGARGGTERVADDGTSDALRASASHREAVSVSEGGRFGESASSAPTRRKPRASAGAKRKRGEEADDSTSLAGKPLPKRVTRGSARAQGHRDDEVVESHVSSIAAETKDDVEAGGSGQASRKGRSKKTGGEEAGPPPRRSRRVAK
ncbi:hypothetical protein OH77DRAFT_1128120 [Trametes cingulata]|nr:hypothetical protein OH77DRAFT_1128120 [Trametes cingulata]